MKKTYQWMSMVVILVGLLIFAGCSGSDEEAGQNQTTNDDTQENADQDQQSNDEGEPSGDDDTVKIGLVLADTGPASSMGKPEADVARLLQKQIEDQEFNGKKIELLIEDYETDDTNAVVIMKKLISEGDVSAVVGGTQSSTSIAIGGVAQEEEIPLVALAPLNQEDFNEYIVQAPQSNETVLQRAITYLDENNIDSVAWINARDGFGQTGLPVFESLADENNIDIVAVEDFDAEDNDMTVQLTNIKSANPGAVIVWSRSPGAGIVANNFNQLGFDVPMIQSHAVANQDFLDQVGSEGEGVLVIGSKMEALDDLEDEEQKQLFEEFTESFNEEYGYNPGAFGGYAYDGIQMVLQGIEEGHDTPEALQSYLENISYVGVTGTYEMTPDNRDSVQEDGLGMLEVTADGWSLVE